MKRKKNYDKRFSLRARFQFFVIANTVATIFVLIGLFLTQKKDTSVTTYSSPSISPSAISSLKKMIYYRQILIFCLINHFNL